MKKTAIIIILGIIITISFLGLTIFSLYKIYDYQNQKDKINININNTDTEKVILYMFHGSTCPACLNAKEKIKEDLTILNNLEIRTYEVWNNKDNSTLMQKVAEKLNVDAKYIPFFVINDYSMTGYNETNILNEFSNSINGSNYTNIIEEILKENPYLNPQYEILK